MLFDTTLIIWRYIVGTCVKGGCLFWPGQWSIGITFFFFFSFCWHWSDLDAFGHLRMSGTKCESHVYRTQDWGYESKNTGLHGNSVILFTRSSGQMHISVFFQSFRFFYKKWATLSARMTLLWSFEAETTLKRLSELKSWGAQLQKKRLLHSQGTGWCSESEFAASRCKRMCI